MDWSCCVNSVDSSLARSDEQVTVYDKCTASTYILQKFKTQYKAAEAQPYLETIVLSRKLDSTDRFLEAVYRAFSPAAYSTLK